MSAPATTRIAWVCLLFMPIFVAGNTVAQTPPPDTAARQKKALSNADIIKMSQAGFGEDLIIGAMRANDTAFEVSFEGLFELRNAGVSQKVIDAMLALEASKRAPPALPTPMLAPAAPNSIPKTPPPAAPMTVTVHLLAESGPIEMSPAVANMVQSKAKGTDIGSLALDGAVDTALMSAGVGAITQAAVSTGMATGSGLLGNTVMGAGVGLLAGALLRSRKPTVTFLWALPGQSAELVVAADRPRFELRYENLPGVDPDEYEAVILKAPQTKNNWRLVCATRGKMDALTSTGTDAGLVASFTDTRIASTVNRLGRGHVQIEPSAPLDPGQYALALRPIARTKRISMGYGTVSQEWTLMQTVWDFAVLKPTS